MIEFFGNFFLALFVVGLLRFLWSVCVLLIRTKDIGNRLFAGALPLSLLFVVVNNPVAVASWTGLIAGAIAGGLVVLYFQVRRAGR